MKKFQNLKHEPEMSRRIDAKEFTIERRNMTVDMVKIEEKQFDISSKLNNV